VVACGLLVVGTVVGNVLVVTAVVVVRRLRTPSNLLIVSLAISDLLVAILDMPFAAMYEVRAPPLRHRSLYTCLPSCDRITIAGPMTIRHFDFDILILAFLVFNPGDLYYLGYKDNNINNIIINNMVPWTEGKPLTWDVTVVCPLAESYIGDSATNAGSAAEAAATHKAAKYAGLETTHIFQPVAVENLGTMNASAYGFLAGLGQKISAISCDDRETCYLFQRISVLIQRFNATLLHDSFADENRSDD